MIVNQDIKPEKQSYYLGAKIIAILKEQSSDEVNSLDILECLNREEKVSYQAFSLAMNWLYLVGGLKLSGKIIIKCF